MTSEGNWSVRANYWRGWRALGGHLRVSDGVLTFAPHGLERALGGNTPFTAALCEIVRVGRARRSFLVPRRRLVVATRSGDQALFLVPKLDTVIRRLSEAIQAAGGRPDIAS